ncbi:hypothetical protein GCM10027297_25310 [Parahaliea aestuarii]
MIRIHTEQAAAALAGEMAIGELTNANRAAVVWKVLSLCKEMCHGAAASGVSR